MMEVILTIILTLVTAGSLYLLFGRGRGKVDYNPEDFVPDTELSPEEEAEVLEATFEVLEVEHEQDKEFENNVSKIEEEVSSMSDIDLVNYANSFFPTNEPEEGHALVVTDDKSKFDWEDTAGTES